MRVFPSQIGSAVYARVTTTSRDADPELSCTDGASLMLRPLSCLDSRLWTAMLKRSALNALASQAWTMKVLEASKESCLQCPAMRSAVTHGP